MREYLQRYLDYIQNAGGAVKIEHFDEDWEPIGESILKDHNLVTEDGGWVMPNKEEE